MIRLHLPNDNDEWLKEKEEIKELGARWNPKDKYWFIPAYKDFHPFKKWINEEEYVNLEQACKMKEIMNIGDFFNDLSSNSVLSVAEYTIEGDVVNVYDNSKCTFVICDLIDEHKFRRVLRILIKKELYCDNLLDKRVIVKGKAEIYKNTGTFQLKVLEKPKILGKCSRLIETSKLYERYKTFFVSPDDRSKFLSEMKEKSFKNIYVIAPEGKGLDDFKNNLNFWQMKDKEFQYGTINFSAGEIASLIKIINDKPEESKPDCICLVRGGGWGSEELHSALNNSKLLDQMCESKIPIVTGVGHSTDKDYLICTMLADYTKDTPSEAAEFFNEIVGAIKKRKNKEKIIAKHKNNVQELQEEVVRLITENEDLKGSILKLKNALDEAKNKKSFFSRLFG